jgi:hypothetical protein
MEIQDLLTVPQIAAILKIKENTIHGRRWQKLSGCPLVKIGKRLYAIAAEFWKWFEDNKVR